MIQEQEQRHIYYDQDLKIEAYNLSGIVQKMCIRDRCRPVGLGEDYQ